MILISIIALIMVGEVLARYVRAMVGAGGIGMALDTALNLFQWDRVAVTSSRSSRW
jgi:phosphonate transport system permease protein